MSKWNLYMKDSFLKQTFHGPSKKKTNAIYSVHAKTETCLKLNFSPVSCDSISEGFASFQF